MLLAHVAVGPLDGWTSILPALTLAIGGVVVMLVELFNKRSADTDLAVFYCGLGAALLSMISSIQQVYLGGSGYAYAGALRADGFAAFLGIIISLAVAITILISHAYHKRLKASLGDYLTLILFSASGMVLLAYANELVTIFIGVELMSIPIYILVGIERGNFRSTEAAVKYLILGGFASAFLLLGLMFLYGLFSVTAVEVHHQLPTTVLTSLAPLAQNPEFHGNLPLVILALGLVIIGFAFKVGAVPFHQWVPDVYEGAPTALTGFMAVAVKAAGFGVFLRLLLVCFPFAGGPLGLQFSASTEHAQIRVVNPGGRGAQAQFQPGDVITSITIGNHPTTPIKTPAEFHRALGGVGAPLPETDVKISFERNGKKAETTVKTALSLGPYVGTILWIICILTILVGNLLALTQENLKRMLAYSSIAHTGYLLLGVIAVTGATQPGGGWEILFYLLTYMFMNLGAFAVLIVAGRDDKDYEKISDLQGLAHKRPFIGLAMLISMLGLAGIPLTGGFWGKLGIFYAAIQNGYTALAIIAILGSLLAVYYYLRVIYVIYMKPPLHDTAFTVQPERWSIHFGVAVCAIGTLLIGVFPWPFIKVAQQAVQSLGF